MNTDLIKVLKLITGEEILCTAVFDDGINWEITDAVAVVLQPFQDDKGRTGYGHAFVPWGTLVDGSILIKDSVVVYAAQPAVEYIEQYQKMFGTIVIPPQGLVTAR